MYELFCIYTLNYIKKIVVILWSKKKVDYWNQISDYKKKSMNV